MTDAGSSPVMAIFSQSCRAWVVIELLELIGNNVLIDIQIATHGAKFAIKVSQQYQDDRIYCLFNISKSPIIRKLVADSRRLGSLLYYSQESMKALTYRRWNDRITNLNLSRNTGLKAEIEGVLPKHLKKLILNEWCNF